MTQRQRKHRLGTVNKDFGSKGPAYTSFIHPSLCAELLDFRLSAKTRKMFHRAMAGSA